MWKILISLSLCVVCLSCSKELDEPLTQRETSYNKAFEDYIGKPNSEQTWGDWTLKVPSSTRGLNNDTTTWTSFKTPNYPSYTETFGVIVTFGGFYDGTNTVSIPKGDYWVMTLYKNEGQYYIEPTSTRHWFYAHSKMSSISFYDQSKKKYEPIVNIDSLVLIESLDEYDGVMPQFAYYNELYSENHFEQRIIEHNGIYYVGFDFYADGFLDNHMTNIHERDYIYNDWIIMVIPADRRGQEKVYDEKRVICEDLSSNLDFDFNDLVYDVAIVDLDGRLKTRITIQAVGTTQPINLCGNEVHHLFNTSMVCINSGGKKGGIKKEPLKLYLDEVYGNIRDISVTVFYDNKIHFLGCQKGSIPQKICVSKDYKWNSEGLGIWLSYPRFKDWVSQPSIDGWMNNCKTELVYQMR